MMKSIIFVLAVTIQLAACRSFRREQTNVYELFYNGQYLNACTNQLKDAKYCQAVVDMIGKACDKHDTECLGQLFSKEMKFDEIATVGPMCRANYDEQFCEELVEFIDRKCDQDEKCFKKLISSHREIQ